MAGKLFQIQDWERLAEIAVFEAPILAALCRVSDRQLQRHFRDKFRSTPAQWLRKQQCSRGKELILQGYSTKAAAVELNFGSESHFCREFKKQFGVSPQTFAPTVARTVKMSLIGNHVANGQ